MNGAEKQSFLENINNNLQNSKNISYDNFSTYRKSIKTKIDSCYTKNISLYDRRYWCNKSGDRTSIESLFEYLNDLQVYDVIYSKYSTSSHGLSALENMDVTKNSIGITKPSDKDTVLTIINGYLFDMT